MPAWRSAPVREWSRWEPTQGRRRRGLRPRTHAGDARSISERLWRKAQLAQDAAESLDARIEDEDQNGIAQAVEVREVLERLQTLDIEVSEELDAYQDRHSPSGR